MPDLQSNGKSVFALYFCLVLCVKGRKEVITDAISTRLREIFENIAPSFKISLLEWKSEPDHIQVVFSAQPHTELPKFLNAYKSASSRWIKREFPELRDKLVDNHFWQRSYCFLTVERYPMRESIQTYMQSQSKS